VDRGNEWTEGSNLPSKDARKYASICDTSEGLFVTGGTVPFGTSDECFMYTTKTSSWTTMKSKPTARALHSSVFINGYVYILGGQGHKKEIIGSVDVFDMSFMTWKSNKPRPHGVVCPITAKFNTSVYVITTLCANNEAVYQESGVVLQAYNTVTGRWGVLEPAPHSENIGASLVGHNDKLYLVGGKAKLCLQYDLKVNTWLQLKTPLCVHCFGALVIDTKGKLLLLGGNTYGILPSKLATDTIEEYDFKKDEWTMSDIKMPEPMYFHFAACMYLYN
jgi:hypothetical protein